MCVFCIRGCKIFILWKGNQSLSPPGSRLPMAVSHFVWGKESFRSLSLEIIVRPGFLPLKLCRSTAKTFLHTYNDKTNCFYLTRILNTHYDECIHRWSVASFPLQSWLTAATKMILTTCTCAQDVCFEKCSYLHSICPAALTQCCSSRCFFFWKTARRPERKFSLIQTPTDETKSLAVWPSVCQPQFPPAVKLNTRRGSLWTCTGRAAEPQTLPDTVCWAEWGG